MPHEVFISHSARDKPYADAVCAKLESQAIRCWIAPRDIRPGMDWGSAILEAIDGARVMLLVFSSHANNSPQIKREVERAVNKELIVVPVRVEDVKPAGNLEYFLGTPHWLDAITPPFERHLDFIADSTKFWLERIQSDSATSEAPVPRASLPMISPDQPRTTASPNDIARAQSRPKWIAPAIAALVIALLGTAAYFGTQYYGAQQELAREQAAQRAAAMQQQVDREAEQRHEKQVEQDRQRAEEANKRAAAEQAQKDAEQKAAQERERAAAEARKRAAAEQAQKDAEAAQAHKEREAAEAAAQKQANEKQAKENDCRQIYRLWQQGFWAEAIEACGKSAEEGSANSETFLGILYANRPETPSRGRVPEDYAVAMRWFRKAAEQGNAIAELNMGNLYVNGLGVPRDPTEAAKWYGKAAAQGNEIAKERLKNLKDAP